MVDHHEIEMRLLAELRAKFVRLDRDSEGISGIIVSDLFQALPHHKRQELIEAAFVQTVSGKERHLPHMIAGLTQEEYDMAGAAIRVHRITHKGKSVELFVRGAYSDATYVKDTLKLQARVNTFDPEESSGAPGMWVIRAEGTEGDPLTVALVKGLLERDENIRIMPSADR